MHTPQELASRRKDLLQTLLLIGSIIGGFSSAFKPSGAVLSIFAGFLIAAIGMYCILLFWEDMESGYGRGLYVLMSLAVSFLFGAMIDVLVANSFAGTNLGGSAELTAIYLGLFYLLYLALGILLTTVFNFRGKKPPKSKVPAAT